MIKSYLQNLRNYRSNTQINTVWKTPDVYGCTLYSISELGELADCLVTIMRPNDHRNNPGNKHTEFQKELQDLAMMVGSIVLLLDPELTYFRTYELDDMYGYLPKDKPNVKWSSILLRQISTLVDQFDEYSKKDGEYHKWGILSTAIRIIKLCSLYADLMKEQQNFFVRKTNKILGTDKFTIEDGLLVDDMELLTKQLDKLSDEALIHWENMTNEQITDIQNKNSLSDYDALLSSLTIPTDDLR